MYYILQVSINYFIICKYVIVTNSEECFNFQSLPIILGCCAVMECDVDSVHSVGDHNVWYGQVSDAHIDDNVSNPMLYQSRYVMNDGIVDKIGG